jgi:hemin uptake protein HemP
MITLAQELVDMNDQAKEPAKIPTESPNRQRTLRSEDLLQGAKEVLIAHGEETYRLRLTRNGKLILHK